ncbi:MAG: bifunctional 5,10-methylenetetrahydrofolate dehydrogenase/5,10-methenyltetrahydrofolate cyclohydrolase [Bacilli bacterium]
MIILNGKELSAKLKDELKGKIASHIQTPILAVITIGDDEASKIYVKNKKRECEYVGISFLHFDYVYNVKESVVLNKIKELNKDKSINGILLQLPIPDNYDVNKLLNAIDPIKDVDGLTLLNKGKLIEGSDGIIPCTPKGIMELFNHYKIELEGKNVVVIGRSKLVGFPVAIECMKRNATVTVCHSKTKELSFYTSNADIIITACGKKWLIDKGMIKKDVVIIDVGIIREENHIYGDVNPDVKELCSAMSPVPGGVGPMTVISLLINTYESYKVMNGIKDEK